MSKISFLLPDVGEGVTEAGIIRWLVQKGERVKSDQVVVEVQTDKAVVEIPTPEAGLISEIYYQEGEIAKVGEALFDVETEKIPLSDPKRVLAAPTVRRAARDLGVPLSEVKGNGPCGRVLEEDLRKYLINQQTEEPSQVTMQQPVELPISPPSLEESSFLDKPLSPIRRVISKRLTDSVQTKPHVTHFAGLDVTGVVDWRERRLQDERNMGEKRTSYFAILLRCIAAALQKHPVLNSHYLEEGEIVRTFSSIDCGIAVDTKQGLLVPILRGLEKKGAEQVFEEVRNLVEDSKEGKLDGQQLKGSTFTVSNVGTLGGDWATPILNPPEVAILALHLIQKKPIVAEDGTLAIGWRMNVSLTFDHRVLDGAAAIAFTNTLEHYTSDITRLI